MNRKIISGILTLFLCTGNLFGQYENGNWQDMADVTWFTSAGPQQSYEISNAAELAGLAVLVNQGHTFKDTTFTLTRDIDLSDHYWTPIGRMLDINKGVTSRFCGIFNGNGKAVRSLSIFFERPGTFGEWYAGLFGYIGDGAKLTDITVETGYIPQINMDEHENYHVCVGGLVGWAECTSDADSIIIRNCHVKGGMILAGLSTNNQKGFGPNSYTGGIVGYFTAKGKGIIERCSNESRIFAYEEYPWHGSMFHGGIAGAISGQITVSFCRNKGDIDYIAPCGGIAGGVLGSEGKSVISSCINEGRISGDYSTGGIIGQISGIFGVEGLRVQNCLNHMGLVTGNSGLAGGIMIIPETDAETGLPIETSEPHVLFENNLVTDSVSNPHIKWGYGFAGINYSFLIEKYGNVLFQNNLVVTDSICPPIYNLINVDNTVFLSSNYVFFNGAPIGPDTPDGEEGGTWSGLMNNAPVNLWDTTVWEIDKTSQYLPRLKGFDSLEYLNNPLYNYIDKGTHTITLQATEGVTYYEPGYGYGGLSPTPKYEAGTYSVKDGKDFAFSLGFDNKYDITSLKVLTDDGQSIPLYPDIYSPRGPYILREITKDVTIKIEGVVVSNERISDSIHIWASQGRIHIQSDDVRQVTVYLLSGQEYKRLTLQAGETVLSVPAGLYIVKAGDLVGKVSVY